MNHPYSHLLVIYQGRSAGKTHPPDDDEISIECALNNSIQIDSPGVSSKHVCPAYLFFQYNNLHLAMLGRGYPKLDGGSE